MSEPKQAEIGEWRLVIGNRPRTPASLQSLISNLLFILILFIATFLRFYHLDHSSLWSDEGNTWALLSRSFAQIAQAAAADIHPPGYYWLLKLWAMLAGNTAGAMRSFSALTGVALVYVIYQIAATSPLPSPHLGKTPPFTIYDSQFTIYNSQFTIPYSPFALLAALLGALNPFQIYYSQEARMYMLLALASAGLFWAVLQLERSPRLAGAFFCLWAIVGLWTHYSFPIILAAATLAGIWPTRHQPSAISHQSLRQRLRPLLFANLLALLAFLPWLPTALDRVLNWPKGGVSTALATALTLTLQTLTFGPLRVLPEPQWPWLVGVLLLPLLGILALRRSALGAALGLWLLAPLVLLLSLGLFSPAFLKFLLLASPAWCLATAAAPLGLLERTAATRYPPAVGWVAGSMIGVLAAGLAFVTLPDYYTNPATRDNYAGVARYVQVLGDPQRDLVLLNAPGQQEVWRYYDPGLPILALPQQRPPDPAATLATLATAVQDRRQIFALFWATDEADPQSLVEQWLNQAAFPGLTSWQGNLRFVTYSLPHELTCQPTEPAAPFGAQILLVAACQPAWPQPVTAGEVALVGLRWQTTAPLSRAYKVTVQLLDERNQVVAQHDSEPAGGSQPTTAWPVATTIADNHGLVVPVGTPPGEYQLIVAFYDPSSGQRLPAPDGDAHSLGVIQVIRPQWALPVDILPIQHRLDREFGPVHLVGYDLYRKDTAYAPATPLAAGDLVHFTFYWQAPTPLLLDWPDDLHFRLDLGEQQLTAPLAGGRYPTSQWQAGDLVRGEFDLLFTGQSTAAELTVAGQTVRLPLP